MLVKIFKPLGVVAVAAALCTTAWGQAAAQAPAGQTKNWKDRAEYDLYDAALKIQDPAQAAKRLEILNQWKEKYAQTDFKQERLVLTLDTYRLMNQGAKMLDAARELVAGYPTDMTGLYWLNMLIPVQPNAATDQALIAEGEKAGQGLIANIDTTLGKDKKPAATSDADWQAARNNMEALGHKTLGWAAMARKNNEEAEKHLRDSLRLNPNAGEVNYWLASTLYAQKKVPEALFYFARAATHEGAGALDPTIRKNIDAYLTKAYTGYHGDATGLNELRTLAKANGVPPAGFTIKSVTQVHEERLQKEQQEAASDPQGALWKRIKGELTGDGGTAYFEQVKGSKPEARSFRGTVVSANGKEIALAMSPETPNAELTLRFETPVPKVDPGTSLQFTGTFASFTREPFMVVMDAERADVAGLAGAASKAKPAKRAAPAKRRR